eukprot:CAMPEP_0172303882 /NCGR_PEP_ID=MMETSP1058-20130122/5395_1 /TAXON_ID=83371 /ORGANISM="Detonula confervacea, Strain CCMP 353" /LENGTH=1584 /DNA_ID=CAMNT_0013014919 /DNA_START=83 /DNA_END=4838 /DNA_ORIENTATION=+
MAEEDDRNNNNRCRNSSPSASAWSTFYYNNVKQQHHPRSSSGSRLMTTGMHDQHSDYNFLLRSSRRSMSNNGNNGALLRALPLSSDNDDGGDDTNKNDDDNDDNDVEKRQRKRDIFKRTLGIGGNNNNNNNEEEVVKLNTDNLFKGMPDMDSLLGAPAVAPFSQAAPTNADNYDDENKNTLFQKQGQKKEPNLLTPADISALDSKYDELKAQSEQLISEELTKGRRGELSSVADNNDNDYDDDSTSSGSGTNNNDGRMNISQEEARKIVDYAVDEEKRSEQREWNEQKKRELVESWELESRQVEERIQENGGEDLLNNDAVSREIIANDDEKEYLASEAKRQREELDFYERQLLQRKEVEMGDYERANAASNSNNADDADDNFDTAYESALTQIQASRSSKLGPTSLGVMANSIALEEGLQYVRDQKVQREFIKEVEQEAGLVDASDEDVALFFKAPVTYEEERMYRSIVRQIVVKRVPVVAEKRDDVSGDEYDDDDDDDESFTIPNDDQDDITSKAKYQLSPKETVEAYKLLNLWREMHSSQDAMERALGMKDDNVVDSMNIANTRGRRSRPSYNKLEPLFLYEEDTEEKRQKEKDNLTKVLKKGLESDNDVDNSSNELLMKELLEGGITKDRAVRLLDKLLQKQASTATDEADSVIRTSLEELKAVIMEEEDVDDGNNRMGSSSSSSSNNQKSGPIDLSGVFRTSDMEEEEEEQQLPKASSAPASQSSFESSAGSDARTMPSWVEKEKMESTLMPPNAQEEVTPNVEKMPPPPQTPFFQSSDNGDDDDDDKYGGALQDESSSSSTTAGGMFGTYEEQRLQKLATKVGASTEKEMEELRQNMKDLKEAEEMANAQLSDDEFDIAAASAKLGIDVTSLNLDDDSDDQIMSVIGKRPVAPVASINTPSGDQQRKAVLELNEDGIAEDIIVDAHGHLKKMNDEKDAKHDVASDIFRANTAGRYHDEETRDADEAAYREFIKMEEEADKKFDSIDDSNDDTTLLSSEDEDIDAYADDIMSEMKPRPQIRGRRQDFMSQEEIQKERKKESIFGFGDDDDIDPFPAKDSSQQQAASSSYMPEWFHKEQEARGIKVEDLNDDDFDDAKRKWEREERQQKADEYLKKRGEGISISDVLGREYFGPMDESEDSYERTSSTFDSFLARKELLLGYTELTVEDINNIVDYKVDPLSTGYNQYLQKVQRQYSEYGAIFRLEGVLVDMIGMHARAWKKVAETYGYQVQSSDDVKQASLYKPEDAVREVFHWTDDIFELKGIAETHRAAFNEAFNEWLASDGNDVGAASSDEQVSSASGTDTSSSNTGRKTMPGDEEIDSMYFLAWSKLSKDLDKAAPTKDQVSRGIMGRDWEVAVKDIFGWSDDPNEIYDIVVAYDEIFQADYKVLLLKYGIDLDKMNANEEETLFGLNCPDLSLQEGVEEWLDTLQEVDMPCAIVSHLDSSQLDAVLNITGLATYFPPDKRVSSDSNYSSERSELLGAALRVEQRPDQSIVFDNTPNSANEAHEVGMKSVSFVDHYVRYELLTADLSVGYVRDLDLRSLVKMFDKREDMEPLLELDVSSGLQKEQRKLKTAFWDE